VVLDTNFKRPEGSGSLDPSIMLLKRVERKIREGKTPWGRKGATKTIEGVTGRESGNDFTGSGKKRMKGEDQFASFK